MAEHSRSGNVMTMFNVVMRVLDVGGRGMAIGAIGGGGVGLCGHAQVADGFWG